jgi:hypothetical protein
MPGVKRDGYRAIAVLDAREIGAAVTTPRDARHHLRRQLPSLPLGRPRRRGGGVSDFFALHAALARQHAPAA